MKSDIKQALFRFEIFPRCVIYDMEFEIMKFV